MRKYILIFSLLALASCSKKQDAALPKSSAKAILSFSLNVLSPAVDCTVDDASKTITGIVPYGTNVTSLAPTITISAKASVSPGSGIAANFTGEKDYTVTAEDGSTQVYKVTISPQPRSNEAVAAQLIENATYPSTYGVLGHLTSVLHAFGTEVIYPKDTIVAASSSGGVMPSFNYNSNWRDSSARVVPPPAYLGFRDSYNFTGAGNYNDGNTFSSTYSDAGDYVIIYYGSNLPFTITYSRSETVVTETGTKNTFTDKITWNSANLLVNNQTQVIMSGTAAVIIQITINGQVSSYHGTITFMGGTTRATLTFSTGTSYPLQW